MTGKVFVIIAGIVVLAGAAFSLVTFRAENISPPPAVVPAEEVPTLGTPTAISSTTPLALSSTTLIATSSTTPLATSSPKSPAVTPPAPKHVTPPAPTASTPTSTSDLPPPPPREPKEFIIEIKSATVVLPANLEIHVGDTVTFINEDTQLHWPGANPHPTHSSLPSFDALGGISPGQSYSHTFRISGSFGYHEHLLDTPPTLGVITVLP